MIVLCSTDFIAANRVRIGGSRAEHIVDVLRAREGDCLCVGLLDGKLGKGRVLRRRARQVDLDVRLTDFPPSPLPVVLALAMPRPIVFKRLLSAVTAIGVKKIVVFHSRRVEKSYWASPVLREEAVREALIQGLAQARDTVMPEVVLCRGFQDFLRREVRPCLRKGPGWVAHPTGPASEETRPSGDKGLVVIGPEGGFIPYELDRFKEEGLGLFRVGARALRVETAVSVILGRWVWRQEEQGG